MEKENKKRILYLESSYDGIIGGSHFSLFYLIKGLDKTIYTPIVALYERNEMMEKYENEGAEVVILKREIVLKSANIVIQRVFKPFFSLLNLFILLSTSPIRRFLCIKKHKIDLVHLNNSALINKDWVVGCKLALIPCVAHKRGISPYVPTVTRIISERVNCIICISFAVHKSMTDCGFKADKLEVIHNGIDPDSIIADVDANDMRKKYGIGDSYPVLGIVGNIKSWKGQHVVIKAVKNILETYPDCKCLIVGDNSENDNKYKIELEALIETLDLKNSIIFTGPEKNVANPMNIMDIVIHASTDPEPFGRVIIEAMSLSKPVIASRAGGVKEIIDEPHCGLMHTPGDDTDLSEKILQLLDSDSLSETIAAAGRQRVESKFHYKINAQKTMQIYERYLKNTT